MTIIEELDQGIKTHTDAEAAWENIKHWLRCPLGGLCDWPEYGNTLDQLKFRPDGPNLAVLVEMSILQKMPRDIEGLRVVSLKVEWPDIDVLRLGIDFGFGFYQDDVKI